MGPRWKCSCPCPWLPNKLPQWSSAQAKNPKLKDNWQMKLVCQDDNCEATILKKKVEGEKWFRFLSTDTKFMILLFSEKRRIFFPNKKGQQWLGENVRRENWSEIRSANFLITASWLVPAINWPILVDLVEWKRLQIISFSFETFFLVDNAEFLSLVKVSSQES